jgi:hypothetical protein
MLVINISSHCYYPITPLEWNLKIENAHSKQTTHFISQIRVITSTEAITPEA